MSVPHQAPAVAQAVPTPLALPVGMRVTPKAKKLVRLPRKGPGPCCLPAAERQQLVQTLHDTVCQSLTAAYFSAKFIEKKFQDGTPLVAGELNELCEMIHGVVGELQEFSRKLRGEESAGTTPGGETIH